MMHPQRLAILHLFVLTTLVCGNRILIVPSTDSPCPGEVTGEPCLTIQQYVSNFSPSRSTNLVLQSGTHNMRTQLSVSDVDSFTMHGNNDVTLNCREQFIFRNVDNVHLSGITFVNCDGDNSNADRIRNITFENCNFQSRTFGLDITRSTRATIVNTTFSGGLFESLFVSANTLMLKGCTFSGTIRIFRSKTTIEQSIFRNIHGRRGSIDVGFGHGRRTTLNIIDCTFINNSATSEEGGGAITTGDGHVVVSGSRFINNSAPFGGAIHVTGMHRFIHISNSTFVNNSARMSGGAIYSDKDQTTVLSVKNSTFSDNTAQQCGVFDVQGTDQRSHNVITFDASVLSYNSAGSSTSGGGVMCTRDASITIIESNLSHNYAIGAAGVLLVGSSTVNVVRSTFENNTAERDGGVLATTHLKVNVQLNGSSLMNNHAGDDGGVLYIGVLGSRVVMNTCTASFNEAVRRGGVVFIAGSTLEVNHTNLFNNSANLGEVISACNSDVILSDPLKAADDPLQSVCTHYDGNVNVSETYEDITTTASLQDETKTTTMMLETDVSTTMATVIATTQTEESTTAQTTEAGSMATLPEATTLAPQNETEETTIGGHPQPVTVTVTTVASGVTATMAPQTETGTEIDVTLMESTTIQPQTELSTTDKQVAATIAVRTTVFQTEESTTNAQKETTTTDIMPVTVANATDTHTKADPTGAHTAGTVMVTHTEMEASTTPSETATKIINSSMVGLPTQDNSNIMEQASTTFASLPQFTTNRGVALISIFSFVYILAATLILLIV